MVTTGLIHALMNVGAKRRSVRVDDVYSGLLMGQWLAALNCAFVGARGLFHAFSGAVLRDALASSPERTLDIESIEPYAGYELSDRQVPESEPRRDRTGFGCGVAIHPILFLFA